MLRAVCCFGGGACRRPFVVEDVKISLLEATREVHGPRHSETLVSMANLAYTLSKLGRYAEAEACYWEVLDDDVLWDLDGTLADSTQLAFQATNEVLRKHGASEVSLKSYKIGCRYTTPERFGGESALHHAVVGFA